jgi:hypothetical protein
LSKSKTVLVRDGLRTSASHGRRSKTSEEPWHSSKAKAAPDQPQQLPIGDAEFDQFTRVVAACIIQTYWRRWKQHKQVSTQTLAADMHGAQTRGWLGELPFSP